MHREEWLIPVEEQNAATTADQVESQETPAAPPLRLSPVASLKRHRLQALIVFCIIFLLGLPVVWLKGRAKYQATAVIYVSPRFQANLEYADEFELQSNQQYREYVNQNARTINRYDIVADALRSLAPHQDLWIKKGENFNHAVERLQNALIIEPVVDTYQITIGLQGNKPKGLAEVVNAVVNTFLVKVRGEDLYGSDTRVQSLVQERDQLLKDIADKQNQRALMAAELGVSTFTEAFPNPFDKLLIDAEQALAEARRASIAADAQLAAVDETKHPGALQAYALDQTTKDPALSSLEASENARRTVLLSTINGLSEAHPGRKIAEQELQTMSEQQNHEYQSLLDMYEKEILNQRKSEAAKERQVVQQLEGEVKKQAANATEFSQKYQKAIQWGQEIEREQKRVDSINDRLNYFSLESHAPGFVHLFSSARTPDTPVKGGRKKLLLLLLFGASFLAVLTALAIDFLDPRIHWPGDVHRALGFAPMGWLMEKSEAGEDFAREQILRLASRIGHEREVNGSQIFAFTAVRSGSGTTTLVMELALALCKLGVPTLAVEANAYRADPRYRKQQSRGLSVVLHGLSSIESVIVSGDAETPDHVPVGEVEHLDNLPDLHKLVDLLRGSIGVYSVVLVDVPPLLVSVDAELIARSADVAVLVIEAEKTTKGDLKRALSQLRRISPRAMAAVLNHVRADAANGFGREAKEEYYTGRPKEPVTSRLQWLWK